MTNSKTLLATVAIVLIVATILVIYLSNGFSNLTSLSLSNSTQSGSDDLVESGPLTLASSNQNGVASLQDATSTFTKTQSLLLPIRLMNFSTTTASPSSSNEVTDEKSRFKDFNDPNASDDVAWAIWLEKYKPHYYNSANNGTKQQLESDSSLEIDKRKQIFLNNRNYILAFNKQKSIGFKLKLNQFGDLTTDEINGQYIGDVRDKQTIWNGQYQSPPPVKKIASDTNGSYTDDDESIDWFKRGVVYPARDQGKCHSGQIQSLVSHIDSIYKIKGQPQRFSTQEVLDCLKNKELIDTKKSICEVNLPMVDVLFYLQQKGIHQASDYPSTNSGHRAFVTDGECKLNKITNQQVADSIIKIHTYNMVHPADINEALQNIGPLPVMLNAGLKTFHFYSEGVYDDKDCSRDKYNHHALLIGYDGRHQAWIVQNSFGQQWGQSGQILIKRTSDNLCGLEEGAIHINLW